MSHVRVCVIEAAQECACSRLDFQVNRTYGARKQYQTPKHLCEDFSFRRPQSSLVADFGQDSTNTSSGLYLLNHHRAVGAGFGVPSCLN